MVLKYDRANLLTKPTSTANTPKRCQSRCRTCPPSSCKLPPYIYQRLNKGGASKHLTGNNPQQTLPGPSRPLARPDAHPEAHLRLKQRRLRVRAGRRHLQDVQNVSEAEAMGYVLGYTAANDISSRASQFAQSQWCYSKGFDKSCPLGPALVCRPR